MTNEYDIAVIGGGPAGMMAAGQAAVSGKKVVLLEKNSSLGIKLLTTGGGRCNLSNRITEHRKFIERIGRKGKFLFSALHQFGVDKTAEFFEGRGLALMTEDHGRIFPQSDKSRDVLQAMIGFLEEGGVEVRYSSEVSRVEVGGSTIDKIVLINGEEIIADQYVLATGGKSYPGTGSTGEAYEWLRQSGHNIIEPRPCLTPIIVEEKYIRELEGLSMKNIKITLSEKGKKITSQTGEVMFTRNGLSGPSILDLSRAVGANDSSLSLDLLPDVAEKALEDELIGLFQEDGNKYLKNIVARKVTPRMSIIILSLLNLDHEQKAHSVTKEERKQIIKLLKDFKFTIKGLAGFEKAMVTSGGVDLAEVDPKTMKSKIINNLYFAGEVLDLDGPTGGFNLQICWTTGFVAGNACSNAW